MSYPVKWFCSEMEGAPNMGQAVAVNQLIPVLKAFLVTGFGLKTADSFTYDPVTKQGLITISAGHKYLVDSVILVAGANEAGYVGEHRVTWVSTTQLKVEMPVAPTVNTATGSITVKIPSLGWQVLAEDATNNRIIFASSDPAANGLALLIDNGAWTDNGSWNMGRSSGDCGIRAKASVVSNVVDINTYTVEIAAVPWPASHIFSANGWHSFGDSRLFHFLPKYTAWNYRAWLQFGDGASVRPGDKYLTMLFGISSWGVSNGYYYWNSTNPSYSAGAYSSVMRLDTVASKHIARDYHQLPGQIPFRIVGPSVATTLGAGLSLPNKSDNGFYVQSDPPMVFANENDFRGYIPGIRNPLASNIGMDKTILKNIPNIPGRSLLCLAVANNDNPSTTSQSLLCFDITGPWR